jgi:hypothetical protein
MTDAHRDTYTLYLTKTRPQRTSSPAKSTARVIQSTFLARSLYQRHSWRLCSNLRSTCAWRASIDVLPVRHSTIGRQHATARSQTTECQREDCSKKQKPWRIPVTAIETRSQFSAIDRRSGRQSLQRASQRCAGRGCWSKANLVPALEECGYPGSGCSLSHANGSHRPRPTANGRPQPRTSIYWKETMHGKTKMFRPSTMQRWSPHVSRSWMRLGSAAM